MEIGGEYQTLLPSSSCIEDGDAEAGRDGVAGESGSGDNSLREVLSKLGEIDAEQRERLERAQRFLEAELTRFVDIADTEERRDVFAHL